MYTFSLLTTLLDFLLCCRNNYYRSLPIKKWSEWLTMSCFHTSTFTYMVVFLVCEQAYHFSRSESKIVWSCCHCIIYKLLYTCNIKHISNSIFQKAQHSHCCEILSCCLKFDFALNLSATILSCVSYLFFYHFALYHIFPTLCIYSHKCKSTCPGN